MNSFFKKTRQVLSNRAGFFWLVLFLFWLKTYLAYQNNFTLGVNNTMQQFLLLLNPLPVGLLLIGIGLYFGGKKSYWIEIIVSLIQSTWLFANTLYYREFSDFLSFGIIKSSSSVSNNLGSSILEIIHPTDFLLFLDVVILILMMSFKVIQPDQSRPKRRYGAITSVIAIVLFGINLSLAEGDRSQLLTRTFDNNYIVKYLGVDFFAGYSAYQTHQQTSTRKNANSSDVDKVLDFVNKNRSQPNVSYYGKEKGKNVFIFHLESFQQFLINYKSDGEEVTPNINRFYADQHTMSFDNFFNQVGQGKTSDAETMLETSLYGLPSGSSMTSYGSSNTYQALPAFLDQRGYATASMHGDVGSFWNRDNTYKSWGYQYFFDSAYFDDKDDYNNGYGMKDKIFLKQSAKYLEQLPQPFYAKIITVTNHYPYDLDKQNQSIAKTKTGDKTVDGYVQTAHYLDQAFGEFINYLKKSGLYDDSMIVAYGDHYGISNNHPKALAKLLGKKSVSKYDLAMLEKVPFMIHSNNLQGGVNHTYGGEIDVMPTLMDLLGIKDDDTIQLGNDLLSTNRNQTVAFRNGDFVSPDLSKLGSKVYDNQGKKIDTKKLTAQQKQILKEQQDHTDKSLSMSDKITTGDLLRFYTPQDFNKVDKSQYKYKYSDGIKALKKARREKKSSLIDQNGGKSTQDLYETDAPELKDDDNK
ncbi:sulfatase family protein [Ligilactobacillus acidipiscis DSM 15836]|uniref:Lipoteichoic acid synthase LtaS Type IIa n=2 Tax=Ligilactobacillus acidipiscis TaxID=89059 RepID=A0A0R2KCA8_9LACO|nr:LTA synthase family protein [Ligilactobacillus acidipiscis]KRM22125.1 sulfatase family protein [Ligilactobacillus acidipiscis DSM 15836]KRN87107.1 sulfatase family protein [Ligilactobacillus acidipiscis]SFV40998.1 Lipoteichoic acid synthase LtaS Type IIa [Ligilactobacillus acidipiscis]GAW64854.1 alkaline phosphatase [Ligilactobacillus acidipiscis]GEN21865.1 glycerol phosphate lipoteichoic acid synthase [Ligilactobacillus acidipiscis]